MRRLIILEAIGGRALFGALPAFRDLSTWRAWLVFLAALYGLALEELSAVGVDAVVVGTLKAILELEDRFQRPPCSRPPPATKPAMDQVEHATHAMIRHMKKQTQSSRRTTVLSINSIDIWRAAGEACERAKHEVASRPISWTFEAVVAITLSAAAAEAFINELGEHIAGYGDSTGSTPSQLRVLGDVLEEMEVGRASTLVKYLMAGHILGAPFDRGANPFQDFASLSTIRDQCMHVKTRDEWSLQSRTILHVKWPKVVMDLKQRGLAKGVESRVRGAVNETVSSFTAIQTPEVAQWACDTSAAIVKATLKKCPSSTRSPVNVLRNAWGT